MNAINFKHFRFFRGRSLVLLTVILLVAGLFYTDAPITVWGSMRSNPDDFEPIGGADGGPPPFVAPTGGFTWSIEKRYGPLGDYGMIETHWIVGEMKYEQSYIYPANWRVDFNGCLTANDFYDGETPDYTYSWLFHDGSTSASCHPFKLYSDQAPHTARLAIEDMNGNDYVFADGQTFVQQEIQIKDYFIVSIGDSYGSGQGNPDIPQVVAPGILGIGWQLEEPAYWQDERCHRSANSASSLAALELENSDPHSTVTYINFACTGATLNTTRYDTYWDPLPHTGDAGEGVLGSYRGEITNVGYTGAGYIPPQIDQVRNALIPPENVDRRPIDALIISAGGNDMHFGAIIDTCMWQLDCWNNPLANVKENPNDSQSYSLYQLVDRALGKWGASGPANSIPNSYAELGADIDELSPRPLNVYIMQYPDQTYGDNGDHCRMLDDITAGNPYFQFTIPESAVASHFALGNLNMTILTSTLALSDTYTMINWQYVDGLSVYNVDPFVPDGTPGLFVGPVGGPGHGYCASDSWIRTGAEAEIYQGPVNWRAGSKGPMHPNLGGQQAIKSRILYYLLPDLAVTLPTQPPTFTFSFTSAGLTSQPGGNGWFVRSCDAAGTCYPKVVVQAVATSDVPMTGAGILINDISVCGGGVECVVTPSEDGKQITFDIAITASGIYRLQFNALNPGSQLSSLQREIKVDLEDPLLATPVGPFEVDEGGSVTLAATVAVDAQGIPLNNDVIVNYDWDLDLDGVFETTDEQPSFSAAGLDGPASQAIQVRVTDVASRTATAETVINIANVAPVVIITDVPMESPEGTEIHLTSNVTDPGELDTFTYAWEVKRGGNTYATGSEAGLSFTPGDAGMYEVYLTVTDDDGGVGSAMLQTIEVTNVRPVFGNIALPSSVDEAAGFTLSGDITDPGWENAFALTIDWGDGSTPELVSLAAGSTGFSVAHTYADDAPSGTSADTYQVALDVRDGEGGWDVASASVVVNNLPPSVTITAPENGALYASSAMVNLSASLADPSSLDAPTCSVNWADGSTETVTLTDGVCSASHAYTVAGVYVIQLTGADDDLGETIASVMAVVYDPTAGFVTGGGWIDSPAGAYLADTSLSGKASFGFVSKYKKGETIPTGNTAFNFDLAGLSFASQSYEWLVVNQSGTNAQFKGSGTLNGALDPNGNAYKFMVWAGDGSPDTFRIKIWWEGAAGEQVVYDNGASQAIGGGSIVVHTGK